MVDSKISCVSICAELHSAESGQGVMNDPSVTFATRPLATLSWPPPTDELSPVAWLRIPATNAKPPVVD